MTSHFADSLLLTEVDFSKLTAALYYECKCKAEKLRADWRILLYQIQDSLIHVCLSFTKFGTVQSY